MLVAVLSVSIVLKGQGNETKSAEAKPKDAVEQKKPQDDNVLTYDISSLQDSASLIILVIQEYNQNGMVSEVKGQRLKMAKTLSIGFSPRQSVQSDSMVTVSVHPEHQNGLATTKRFQSGFQRYDLTLSFPLPFMVLSGGIPIIRYVVSAERRN